MGGGGKKQTVGYKYFLGMHCVLTHGPVDALLRLRFDKRDAWTGSTGAVRNVACVADKLFGGEDREGGVSGFFDFENGGPTQTRNPYLQGQLGADIPAYRGVTAVVFHGAAGLGGFGTGPIYNGPGIGEWLRVLLPGLQAHGGFYFGMNPYLKPFGATLRRIHVTGDGDVQWYNSKAAVGSSTNLKTIDADFAVDASLATVDPSANNSLTVVTSPEDILELQVFDGMRYGGWSRWDDAQEAAHQPAWWCAVHVRNNDTGTVTALFTDSANTQAEALALAVAKGPQRLTGASSWTVYCRDDILQNRGGMSVSVKVSQSWGDMNPAHIIRECLIDQSWGMGYQAADVDDTSFMAAADTLFDEGFGLSILWDKTMSIQDFIQEIIRHINATLYVDRVSGKFTLKLIRDDYDVASILVLDEDSVSRVDNLTRPAFGDLVNSVTVNYDDQALGNTGSVGAEDPALVQMQGTVIGSTVSYPGVSYLDLAARLASRDLRSLSTPLLSCTVYANRKASVLNIGDVFLLDWPDLLQAPTVMRVMGLAFGDGRSNQVKITAAEDIFALPQASFHRPEVPQWDDPSSEPVAATERIVQEAPYALLIQHYDQATVDSRLAEAPTSGHVAVSAVKPSSGSINMKVQVDAGSGFEDAGVADFSPRATLDADAGYLDTVLQSATAAQLGSRVGEFVQVDDELMRLDSVDTDAGTITVGRGVLDTVPAKHLAGASITSWGDAALVSDVEYASGEELSVRVLPTTGLGTLSESRASAVSLLMDGRAARPYPPGNVKVAGAAYPATVSGSFTVTWSHRNRLSQSDALIDTTAGDVTPYSNLRYGLRFMDASDGTVLVEQLNIGPGTADVVLNFTGDVLMELFAIDDVDQSLQSHELVFTYTPPGGTVTSAITATAYTPVDDSTIIDGGEV